MSARLLGVAALALLGCDGASSRATISSRSPIIGGAPSTDPAVVLLVSYPVDESVLDTCTAVVVAPKVLLTAAHCVDPTTHPGHTFGVFTGADANAIATPAEIAPKLVAVTKLTMHPDYDSEPPFHADLAVVELDAPLAVEPLPFARSPLPPSIVGQEARIVGYGATHYGDANYAQHAAVTKIAAIDAGDTITVGDATHRSCVGDSGGPAITAIDAVQTVVGVDSYADLAGCLEPAHYRRLDVYSAFLASFVPTGEGGTGGASSSSSTSASAGGGSATDDDGGGCSASAGTPEGALPWAGALPWVGALAALVVIRRRRGRNR